MKPEAIEPALASLAMARLKTFDGTNSSCPPRILLSIRGRVFDVSSSKESYGPGGNYRLFAGSDVTKCLATMSLSESDLDDLGYMPGTPEEEAALVRWESRLGAMYSVVGYIEGDNRRHVKLKANDSLLDAKTHTTHEDTADGGKDACPFTGKKEGTCPFGFEGGGSVTKTGGKTQQLHESDTGECPWPFIMLHDPLGGWGKHRDKNVVLGVSASVALLSFVVVRWSQH